MEPTTGEYDSNIRGFKAFYLTTFLLAMVWVGIHPVLVPTFILSQTGSATDVALVLTLMSLGALAVPLVTGVADRYRAHRQMQLNGNDYLARAVVTMVGLGANPREDAIYPVCVSDANGDPVMGEKRYTIHFAADKLPPVGAFWSLTMYDHEGFPVPNALDRYAIGDRDALVYNADGSLDIYIQHESPGPDKEPNWLPSPASGQLGLTMRLYQPMPAILSGAWLPPPLVKAD